MKPYADTNFFTRVFLALPESERADRLLAAARAGDFEALPVTWLHRVELAKAFEFSVWLGKQGGHPRVTAQQAAVALEIFREDLAAGTFLHPVRLDPTALEAMCTEAVMRHTARHGFRTYDLLHVVSAQLLGCDQFFSFDVRARKLAALEGLDAAE